MAGFLSPFGSDDDALFDDYDEFVPDHLPEPGPFLETHDVLTDDDHVEFHQLTQELFEERKVYDMTFNYNLARLNLDTRHKNAGYRYASQTEDQSILHAEFTPTTPFCPQTHTLTIGSFRAWNGLSDRHSYDLVRVRAAPMHQQSEEINQQLAELEEAYLDTGTVEHEPDSNIGSMTIERAARNESLDPGKQGFRNGEESDEQEPTSNDTSHAPF